MKGTETGNKRGIQGGMGGREKGGRNGWRWKGGEKGERKSELVIRSEREEGRGGGKRGDEGNEKEVR